MTEAEARTFETVVSGVAIRGLREGAGAPLVILHHSFGNPGWLALHADLAADHAVLAPDLPGYGGSSRPTWARDPRDLAILLGQWMDREGIATPHLVGLGFGGYTTHASL